MRQARARRALAAALLAVCAPLALVALAPVRGGLLPRLGSATCIGRGERRFRLRFEVVAPGRSGFTRLLARSALPRWPVLLSVVAGHSILVPVSGLL